MTHTLHRRGSKSDLAHDYVVLAMAARGVNRDGAIICQNNFRHSFSLTWSGKTCDIRRSL